MNAFEFEDVSFAYPHHEVFTSLNLTVGQGDFVAIVGGNGSGKSTFLKLCVGILKPTGGQIRIFGQPAASFSAWSKVGYVPQNPLRDKSFPITVEEVVAMGRVASLGIGRRIGPADRAIIVDSLKKVGVEGFRTQVIGNLSGGQQQRVMVARALAAQPDVLILDEPTAGIDAQGTEEFYSLLQTLNREAGITVLLVSHDVDRVTHYAKTIASLDQGLKFYGPVDHFHQEPIVVKPCAECGGEAVHHG